MRNKLMLFFCNAALTQPPKKWEKNRCTHVIVVQMMKRIDVDDESSLPIRASYRRFVIGIYVATAVAVNSKLWCLLSTPCQRGLNKHPRIYARRIYLRFYSVDSYILLIL